MPEVSQGEAAAAPSLSAGFSLQSAAPVVIFLAVNRFAGLRWAVVAATLWSIKIVVDRRRKGLPLGRFMPIVTAAVLIRGAIGVITDSETVYFGLGIASKYVAAAVLVGSVLLGKPLAAKAAPYLMDMPHGMSTHRVFLSTMKIITLIAGLYYCISATFDIWLFRRSSVEGFVLIRFLANWPLSAAAIVAIVITVQRMQQIPGVDSIPTLVERRLGDLGLHADPGQQGSQE